MHSPITLDALRVLDAIERRKSFAAAAEELYRVPSAISYTVSKLEEELGVALFDRSKRRAVLTPVGQLVLEQGRQILRASEELAYLAREAAAGWEVELRIAVDATLDVAPVYGLLQRFHGVQTRTQVRFSEEVLAGSWDALSDQRCDLVIGAEGEPPVTGISTYPLGEVEMVFAVAAGHPLCALPAPLTPAQVRQYPRVVVADSSRGLPARSVGLLDGQTRVYVPNVDRKIQAQCQGIGVGFLPRQRISQQLASGQLRVLQLQEPAPPARLSMAWRSSQQGKALRWFIEQVKALPAGALIAGGGGCSG